MMHWSVKVEWPGFTEVGQRLHRELNSRGVADLDDAVRIAQSVVGPRFLVIRADGSVRIHPVSSRDVRGHDGTSPVLLVSPRKKRSDPSRTMWGKVHERCPECGRSHKLFHQGAAPPMVYGYVCPQTKKVVVFRVDHEGWRRNGKGDLRAVAIAVPRIDRILGEHRGALGRSG